MIVWKIVVCIMLEFSGSTGFVERLLQRSSGIMDKLLQIKTCGHPKIANTMDNRTVMPGDKTIFNCKVDMSCMVSSIKWYHEMENGTEILIKTAADKGEPNVHVIKSVSTTDMGLYTCVAKNVLGKAHAAAYLAVNSASIYRWNPVAVALILLLERL